MKKKKTKHQPFLKTFFFEFLVNRSQRLLMRKTAKMIMNLLFVTNLIQLWKNDSFVSNVAFGIMSNICSYLLQFLYLWFLVKQPISFHMQKWNFIAWFLSRTSQSDKNEFSIKYSSNIMYFFNLFVFPIPFLWLLRKSISNTTLQDIMHTRVAILRDHYFNRF